MEDQTLYNGVPLANNELLARLRRNSDPDRTYPYQLPPAEFHAHIAACIHAIRVPWERGKDRTGIVDEPDDDEPVEAAPVPAPTQQTTTYKRARDLAWTVFPLSEAAILAAAHKADIGRMSGRTWIISPDDIPRLYEEAFQPCSRSSDDQSPPTGT